MGGYGSGRTKRHHITDECISIDLSALHPFLRSEEPSIVATCTETRGKQREQHKLRLTVTRYQPGEGLFRCWDAIGHVTMRYEKMGAVHIPLVTTCPNYGGVRYWFLAPCCGRRVRVLYLTPYDGFLSVQCRVCLDLHYESQQQSFIEKRKTYERYLLANYGYAWAKHEYHCLGKHYQEITPELAEQKARSQFEVQLQFIRRLISFNRLMLRDHTRTFRSLKKQEDRCMLLDDWLQTWGTHHVLIILEQSFDHRYATREEIEALIAIIAGRPRPRRSYTYDITRLVALKKQIEEELEELAA